MSNLEYSYLPNIPQDEIQKNVGTELTDNLMRTLNAGNYERIGLDRLYLILADINKNYGRDYGFSILDVGCNNGLISNFLAAYGNQVTGIDNFVIDTQGRYDKLVFEGNSQAKLINTDIENFFVNSNENFDFTLLLSVAHQWEFGYAQTQENKKNANNISAIMKEVENRTKRAIYYECPMEEPGFSNQYGITFLKNYLFNYPSLSIVKIAETVASNGYIRHLYRISKAQSAKDQQDTQESVSTEKCKPAIMQNPTTLKVTTQSRPRTMIHPSGAFNSTIDSCRLWEKIKLNKPRCIEKVHHLDSDHFATVEMIEGFPGKLLPNTPKWQKAKYYLGHNEEYVWTFSQVSLWLKDLTTGLLDLCRLGLAHGDPYPYNAIIFADGACWVDLANISDNNNQILVDVYVFFTYTVLSFLLQSKDISDNFLVDFKVACMNAVNVENLLDNVKDVFASQHCDTRNRQESDIRAISELIQLVLARIACFDINQEIKYLPVYNTNYYFNEFIVWYNNAFTEQQSKILTERALLFSQMECARLRVSRDEMNISQAAVKTMQDEVENLRSELSHINIKHHQSIIEYESTIANLRKEIIELKNVYSH
ncbi:MAG: methyltransferase domain-containing protein [Angelakisella sp.]|nr:methyltransferase domain-containing protein [Angelakisella sp.]